MISIIEKAAFEAGEVILPFFQKKLRISTKTSRYDIVTEADIISQKRITTVIQSEMKKKYPQASYGFIGEENLLHTSGDYLFVIDPIDGTINFAAGFGHFAVSIGLYYRKMPLAGVVYLPLSSTLYFAQRGKGSYKKERGQISKLQVKKGKLQDGVILGYYSADLETRSKQNAAYEKLAPFIRSLRILVAGAIDLCLLAEGVFLAAVYGRGASWDLAAAQLILEEAGGRVTDLKGKTIILANYFERGAKIHFHAGYYPAIKEMVRILT